MIAALDAPRLSTLPYAHEPEWWETGPVWESTGDRQVAALAKRIEAARVKLSELVQRALEK